MTFVNHVYSPASGPEPDLGSGMAALQRTFSKVETPSGDRGPAATPVPRPKPSVPQKKTHIDELLRLRKELEEAAQARDQASGERDAMANDLFQVQEDFDESEAKITQLSKDLAEKEDELKKLSREMWTWRKKAEASSKRSQVEADVKSRTTRDADDKTEAELISLRLQVQQLTTALAISNDSSNVEISPVPVQQVDQQASMQELQRQFQAQLTQVEEHWRSEAVGHQKLRQAAESGLHGTREYYENKLRDLESQARSQIEDQRRRLQEAETALQGKTHQMEVDSGDTEELDRLRRLAAEQEGKFSDQRQCTEQFRRMSERLTTEVKQANAAKRNIEQSEQAMRQQMEGLKSQMAGSRSGRQQDAMPGSFQRH